MIDPAVASGMARIAAREADVRGAFSPGFVPAASDVVRKASITPSSDPLSVAVPDGAYLLGPDAQGRVVYGRDGRLALVDGELRAGDGRPVLGFTQGRRDVVVPLRVDPYDAALGRVGAVRIDPDGTATYARSSVDPRTGERRVERVTIGRVALARFPAGTQPVRCDAAHVAAPPGVTAHVGVPADGTFGALAVGARDLGRVDLVAGLERLHEAYVGFEAVRAAKSAQHKGDKTVMDLVK